MARVKPSVRNSGLKRLVMLNESYINNSFPIIICCNKCGKWRETSEFEEVSDVPEHWDCSMWSTSDGGKGNCDLPTDVNGEADRYVDETFTPGSLVWAKMLGYPWWPAMVEDDPNDEEYCKRSKTTVEYHVVFLGDPPSRRWVEAKRIKPFEMPASGEVGGKYPIQKERLQRALEEAKRAIAMTKQNRLMEFSLAVRLGNQKNAWKKGDKKKKETKEKSEVKKESESKVENTEVKSTPKVPNSPVKIKGTKRPSSEKEVKKEEYYADVKIDPAPLMPVPKKPRADRPETAKVYYKKFRSTEEEAPLPKKIPKKTPIVNKTTALTTAKNALKLSTALPDRINEKKIKPENLAAINETSSTSKGIKLVPAKVRPTYRLYESASFMGASTSQPVTAPMKRKKTLPTNKPSNSPTSPTITAPKQHFYKDTLKMNNEHAEKESYGDVKREESEKESNGDIKREGSPEKENEAKSESKPEEEPMELCAEEGGQIPLNIEAENTPSPLTNGDSQDMKEDMVSFIPEKSSKPLNNSSMFSNIPYYEDLPPEGKLYAEYVRKTSPPLNFDFDTKSSDHRTGCSNNFNMHVIDSESDPEDYRMPPHEEYLASLWKKYVDENFPPLFQSLDMLSAAY